MNDAPHDPESGDDSHDFVRRLLADARPDSAMPEHVTARLDDTLAELVAQRTAEQPSQQAVEPLAGQPAELADVRARRRRRLLVGLGGLGAAAAFAVAAGVALPAWMGSDSNQTTMSTNDQIAGEQRAAGPLDLRRTSAEKTVQDYVAGLDGPVETPVAEPLSSPLSGALSESEDSEERGTFAAAGAPFTCEEPGDGEVHPATYDGKPALLVLTGVDGDRVLARVVLCGDPDSGASPKRRTSQVPVQFVVPQP